MHTFVWVDYLARIEEFFSASDHDRDFIHVLIGQKITTDRVMNNSASNNSSTQPSEERRKKVWKTAHVQTGNCWWAGCMWEGQYKHLVFGHDRSHPGPRRCAARAWIRRSCPHTQVVLSTDWASLSSFIYNTDSSKKGKKTERTKRRCYEKRKERWKKLSNELKWIIQVEICFYRLGEYGMNILLAYIRQKVLNWGLSVFPLTEKGRKCPA